MISGDGIQARAASLRQEATRRWLVKDELIFLLLHYKLVGVPILHSLQLRPPSGTLLFYDTQKISDYKRDGWHWQKRKDKSGRVREDRAKLVINREVIILGTYVHSAETSTFHRRIYSVRDSKDTIVLVHYFDEANKDPAIRQFTPSAFGTGKRGRSPTVLSQSPVMKRSEDKFTGSNRNLSTYVESDSTRSMLARRSFLQTKHVAIKFQAATRGVLCRKNFARMKAHALASLVIQRNVREWWNKQPAATRIDKETDDPEKDTEEEKTPIPEDAYEAQRSL
ncbi:DNA-directed RNA polymerase III subunit RPC8 [Phytophthora nicotianae]|uniref:DNA-directed RNA polymerase III subunit RPC8 n=1 Tax=Phytophthora nicotianae TaxID=4792 RepID=A0A0W8CTA6_PHYNI|nr:DNA-directed RNA polymerase III subunit RPC8 [Phytophthora nicotianae]